MMRNLRKKHFKKIWIRLVKQAILFITAFLVMFEKKMFYLLYNYMCWYSVSWVNVWDISSLCRNWWQPSNQPYNWGRWWLMRPICVWKGLGQWEQGMVMTVANVAVPFLSFLRSSVAAFLLASQTFVSCLTTSRHLSLSCARYFKQLRVTPKDFMETFSVSLKRFFWPPWECLPRDSSPQSTFFRRWWCFMQTTWLAQWSCGCIKMV